MKPRNRQTSRRAAPAVKPAAPTPAPAGFSGAWRQTLLLIGGGWTALLVCALLWQLLAGGPMLVYFCAAAIGLCYTLAALFSHFYLKRPGGES